MGTLELVLVEVAELVEEEVVGMMVEDELDVVLVELMEDKEVVVGIEVDDELEVLVEVVVGEGLVAK